MHYYLDVLKKYADFDGRARRAEYWYFVLFNFIVSSVLGFMDGMMGTVTASGTGMISLLYTLAVLVPSIAVAVRRMHDVGKSGWFALIPFYNLILAVTEGDKGPNKYGPDPKNPELDITDHLVP
ncbi:MAG: DUF805 domain-containing protein [Bacteroidetes bacterium]|nr:MAG: DUF805 domain-containing protein [Bacteroidota bacterium]